MPSVLVISRGVIVAGRAAADAAVERPDGAIRAAKRKLGTANPIARAPREVVPEDGAAATLALVVREVLDQHGGEPPEEVVVTVPATASEPYERALDASVRIAGVPADVPIRHVEDDVATADRLASAVPEGSVVAVIDLGVRLTASVLRRTAEGFARIGVPAIRDDLGGDRVDELLTSHLLGRLEPDLAASLRDPLTPQDTAARAAFGDALREAKALAAAGSSGAVVANPRPGASHSSFARRARDRHLRRPARGR